MDLTNGELTPEFWKKGPRHQFRFLFVQGPGRGSPHTSSRQDSHVQVSCPPLGAAAAPGPLLPLGQGTHVTLGSFWHFLSTWSGNPLHVLPPNTNKSCTKKSKGGKIFFCYIFCQHHLILLPLPCIHRPMLEVNRKVHEKHKEKE
jgi:hypothetical protein